jgi:3-deoxy-D-manno-octulosonate 8-phosphate phosphatase (KDO 8-P phosphatase)
MERLRRIRLLAMDVDGTLTDGGIVLDSAGGEQKRFHVADGLGLTLLMQAGIRIAWVSGRTSPAVDWRAAELKIDWLYQGVRDKGAIMRALLTELGISREEAAYIGDDWNDLPAFEEVGVRIAAANAPVELKSVAEFVTERSGGQGAVREACDWILEARGERVAARQRYLDALRKEPKS